MGTRLQLATTGRNRLLLTLSELLHDSCSLQPLPGEATQLRRNLFSTLFIMASEAAGVARDLLPFYALVFQCLRAQVTGCDNLLDDEYKSVIPFELEGSGTRFRSVLTVMSADLVLGRMVTEELAAGRMQQTEAQRLFTAVMAVLIPSGLEEHEEESQVQTRVPSVATMLNEVHYRKTGLLFEAPVRLVQKMGLATSEHAEAIIRALALFGGACQILDDLKDVADDFSANKHNLVLSAAFHGQDSAEQTRIKDSFHQEHTLAAGRELADHLPRARQFCIEHALRSFQCAATAFETCLPAFGLPQALALGALVRNSIMSERNESTPGALT